MLCLSIGLPGRFSEWCDSAIAALLGDDAAITTIPARSAPNAAALPSPLDRAAGALIATAAHDLVFALRQPDEHLRQVLNDTGARFVVALDHPGRAALDVLAEAAADPDSAIRAVANSCAAVMRFPALPGGLLLHAGSVLVDIPGTLAAVADHLRIPAGADRLGAVADRLAAGWLGDADPLRARERVPAATEKAMRGAFAGYEECFAGRGFGELIWSRELFFAADPDRRATDILDLAGEPRILVSGPFIHLPPGSWKAQVHLGVSAEAAGQTLLIEAHADGQLAAASVQPAAGGLFAIDIEFAIAEGCRAPVEIRVALTQPHAAGRFALGRVVLQPAGMRRPDATGDLEELQAALDQ